MAQDSCANKASNADQTEHFNISSPYMHASVQMYLKRALLQTNHKSTSHCQRALQNTQIS
eukprot:m.183616 g.183616  ORF g.183616 m.183616 type:complete len:60 (+) comp14695_c1_seq1:59-238(+)